MSWFYLIVSLMVLFIVLLIFIILFTKIYFHLYLAYERNNRSILIEVKFWKFIKLKRQIPLDVPTDFLQEELEEESKGKFKESLQTGKEYLYQIREAFPILYTFMNTITVHTFQWDTKIGLKDASNTGFTSGILWGVKGQIIGLIHNHVKEVQDSHIMIEPSFHQKMFQTTIDCHISFRLRSVIRTMLRLIRIKGKKQVNYKHIPVEG